MNSYRRGFAVRAAAAALYLLTSTAAQATWRKAETRHFVYYSEASPDELRQTVTNLEKFDAIVRMLTGNTKPPSPVKVVMFEVANQAAVGRTLPYENYGIGGYYSTSDMGPFLVTFRQSMRNNGTIFRTNDNRMEWAPEVRQHEYLHHYMFQYFNTNYPAWFVEGFAEYYGTMRFPTSDTVEIGHAPYFRLDYIRAGNWLKVSKLLSARTLRDLEDPMTVYTEGWLLTHLAARDAQRGKQLADYLNRVAKGEDYGAAAKAAFGDLDKLDDDLKAHAKNLQAVRLSLKPMDLGTITITELPDVDGQLMSSRIRLYSGFRPGALSLARADAADVVAKHPDDLDAMEILARLDLRSEQPAEAGEVADRMLAIAPTSATAKMIKAIAMMDALPKDAADTAYEPARRLLGEAARSDLTNPEPLLEFYRSYLRGNTKVPPEPAGAALATAFQLEPQNAELRMLMARDYEWRGMIDDAIYVIKPEALGSFDGNESESERKQRARAIAKEVAKYGRLVVVDTPLEMLHRLEAKRDGRWDEATGRIKPKESVKD